MPGDTAHTVSRSSFAFLSGTLLSRLTGGIRDMVMAFCFGTTAHLASFMVAYRFASLARRLLGESPISSGFVPRFEELRRDSYQKGYEFFRDLLFAMAFFLLIVIGSVELILWGVYHFCSLSSGAAEIIYLCLIMLPGVLFLCLFGLCSSFLQCEKKFFLTGFAPVAFNSIWIVFVFCFKSAPKDRVAIFLSLSMIIAFFFHWAILLPKIIHFMKKTLTWRQIFSAHPLSMDVKMMIRPFFLGILGVGAMQINTALDAVFSRYASPQAPAHLWYAIRLEQVPLGLFAVALSQALLPSLSRSFSSMDIDKYKQLLTFAINKAINLLFPSMVALVVLGSCIVNFVYGRGDFSADDTYHTLLCLWGYSLGLIPTSIVMLLAPAFYAKKSFRSPMIASMLSVCLNVLLNYLFVFWLKFGAISIALATSAASLVNMCVLLSLLKKKIGPLFPSSLLKESSPTALCSLIAGALTLLLGHFFLSDPTVGIFMGGDSAVFQRGFWLQTLELFALGGFFMLFLFSYAWMFGVEGVLSLVGLKKNRILPLS